MLLSLAQDSCSIGNQSDCPVVASGQRSSRWGVQRGETIVACGFKGAGHARDGFGYPSTGNAPASSPTASDAAATFWERQRQRFEREQWSELHALMILIGRLAHPLSDSKAGPPSEGRSDVSGG
jgi:hypothetical protein